jgi:hypothetical protein
MTDNKTVDNGALSDIPGYVRGLTGNSVVNWPELVRS